MPQFIAIQVLNITEAPLDRMGPISKTHQTKNKKGEEPSKKSITIITLHVTVTACACLLIKGKHGENGTNGA